MRRQIPSTIEHAGPWKLHWSEHWRECGPPVLAAVPQTRTSPARHRGCDRDFLRTLVRNCGRCFPCFCSSFPVDSLRQLLFQNLPSPEDSGSHRDLVDTKHGCHFVRRHFFDRRKNERLPQLWRQCDHQRFYDYSQPCPVNDVLGSNCRRRSSRVVAVRIVQGNLVFAVSLLAAVDRNSPRNACQPGFWILYIAKLRAVTQHSHERFLCGIFRIVMAVKDCIGDPIDEACVVPDKSFQRYSLGLDLVGFSRGYFVQDRLSCHHSFALEHEDRASENFVQEFLEGERGWHGNLRAPVVSDQCLVASSRSKSRRWVLVVFRGVESSLTNHPRQTDDWPLTTIPRSLQIPAQAPAECPRFVRPAVGFDFSTRGLRRQWLRRD